MALVWFLVSVAKSWWVPLIANIPIGVNYVFITIAICFKPKINIVTFFPIYKEEFSGDKYYIQGPKKDLPWCMFSIFGP